MNNFWLKKCEKSVTDDIKEKSKEFSELMIGSFLRYLILLLLIKTRFFVSVSSTVKVVNVANYHITV